jgi:CPA2 family monovalent cation:H+ antiporter-2
VPVTRVADRSDRIRADRYPLLQGIFHSRVSERRRDKLQVLTVPAGAFAISRRRGDLRLDEDDVTVTAIRRRGIRGADPAPDIHLQQGDKLIVHGSPEALRRLAQYLTAGQKPSGPANMKCRQTRND